MNNNQIQLARLYIYLSDFQQARKLAAYILEKRLHDKNKTELRELVHSAFNMALIISYSRPFGWNYEFPDQTPAKSSLKEFVSGFLTDDEIKLHERVMTLRNSTYAHSQANSHLIKGLDYNKQAAIMYSALPLDKAAVSKLKNMIEKWIKYLEAEKSKLKDSQRSTSNNSFNPSPR